MEGTPVPFLPKKHVERTLGASSSFDAGRGCPYQCSFCTIINVQGRKSRYRSADDVERIVRLNWAQGIRKFFITDDNFARNREWESTFDRLIELREKEGIPLGLMIQVDTLCHKIPNFMEKAKRAGVNKVFIGLENINPDNLAAAKKRQNKITEYRKMLLAWKEQGILTIAGYILGFPADTPETIRRDIEIIKEELPIDLLEFFCLTPLPGSEDHQSLWRSGVPMDADLNKYDVEHACTAHPRMSLAEWQAIYQGCSLLPPAHMKTCCGAPWRPACRSAIWQNTCLPSRRRTASKVHPCRAGYSASSIRRAQARPVARKSRLFWPPAGRHFQAHGAGRRDLGCWLTTAIRYSPDARSYMDQALTPVGDDEDLNARPSDRDIRRPRGGFHIRKVAELTHAQAV